MLGKLLKERYQIVQFLNAGIFGQTYIAEDIHQPEKPKCVVKHLKLVTSDLSSLQITERRLANETEILRKLGKHDQIPQLLDSFEENQAFYLVQEFIPGHALSAELPVSCRNGFQTRPYKKHWSEKQVINLLQQVLAILEFIHNQGIIHCDIKPNNLIRRASDSKLFLIDFGAVQPVRQHTQVLARRRNLKTSLSISPLGYIPAEQLTGHPQPNSDIYALGIIGIQALTGLEPLQLKIDFNTSEVIWQPSVSTVSAKLTSILRKMVCYDFKKRYQSATEVLDALQEFTFFSQNPDEEVLTSSPMQEQAFIGATKAAFWERELPPKAETPEYIESATVDNQQPLPKLSPLLTDPWANQAIETMNLEKNTTTLSGVSQPVVPYNSTSSRKSSTPRVKSQPITSHNQYFLKGAYPLLTGFAIGMATNSLIVTAGLYALLHDVPGNTEADALAQATKEYQAGDLEKAIAIVKAIPVNSPVYPKAKAAARDWRQNWQFAESQYQIIEKAFHEGRWQTVLAESRKVPYISYWQKKIEPIVHQSNFELETEAQYLLKKAYEQAAQKDFTSALRLLKDIPPETGAGAIVQQKIAEYTEKQRIRADYLLQQAYNQASARDFKGALSFLRQIPKETSAYPKAVSKVAEYVAKQNILAKSQKANTSTVETTTTSKFADLQPGSHLQEVNIHS